MVGFICRSMDIPGRGMVVKLFFWVFVFIRLAGESFSAENNIGNVFRVGEHEIANEVFRFGLTPDPTRPDVPYLTGYRRIGEEWCEAFSWGLVGARFVGEHADELGRRYGSPFQRSEPGMKPYRVVMENIRTGVLANIAFLSFRISREEVWANIRIRLAATEPLLFFEQEASSPGLQAYLVLYLRSHQPFSHYFFGPLAIPSRPVRDSARMFAQTVHSIPARYVGVYRPNLPDFFIFSWPEDLKQSRKIWPYSGAQDLPFALFSGTSNTPTVDIDALGHQGERVRAMTRDFVKHQEAVSAASGAPQPSDK